MILIVLLTLCVLYPRTQAIQDSAIVLNINGVERKDGDFYRYNSGEHLQIECFYNSSDDSFNVLPLVYLQGPGSSEMDIKFNRSLNGKIDEELLLKPHDDGYYVFCSINATHKKTGLMHYNNNKFRKWIRLQINADNLTTPPLKVFSTISPLSITDASTTDTTYSKAESTRRQKDKSFKSAINISDLKWLWISLAYNIIGTIAIIHLMVKCFKKKYMKTRTSNPNINNQEEEPTSNLKILSLQYANKGPNKTEFLGSISPKETHLKIKTDNQEGDLSPANTGIDIYNTHSNRKPMTNLKKNVVQYASLEFINKDSQVKHLQKYEAEYMTLPNKYLE